MSNLHYWMHTKPEILECCSALSSYQEIIVHYTGLNFHTMALWKYKSCRISGSRVDSVVEASTYMHVLLTLSIPQKGAFYQAYYQVHFFLKAIESSFISKCFSVYLALPIFRLISDLNLSNFLSQELLLLMSSTANINSFSLYSVFRNWVFRKYSSFPNTRFVK